LSLASDTPVVVAPKLIHRRVGEAVFVLMGDSSVHWFKNDTAVAIWSALAEAGDVGTTPQAIAQRLSTSFEVSEEAALADASEFLAAMLARHLLQVKNASGLGTSPD
jgi:hypothetical protein